MRGKAGLVIGLAAGYVLGTRAGRERYEQIKTQAQKVWNLAPVQKQVGKLQEVGKSALLAVPTALFSGAVKITKAVTTDGTPGQRLDAALDAGADAAEDVADAAETTASAAKKSTPATTAKRTAAKRSTGGSSSGGK
ncbi:hypothetical protein GCM10027058_17980 [Microbacterium neimengense]